MQRFTPRIWTKHPRATRAQHYSSNTTRADAASHFTKTGEKPLASEETTSQSHSAEYSQSGGDAMVASQGGASFDGTLPNDMQAQKKLAGKGNVVNPLELSPATSELSSGVSEAHTSRGEERGVGEVSGQCSGRKGKIVGRSEVDFK